MLVHQILKSKGDDGVVMVRPGTPLAEVAHILSARRIGTVVVSADEKEVFGIVSERDIVRELGRRGVSCMADTVDEVMSRDVVTCTPEQSADAVMAIMTERRFRHIPVVQDGHMVGLISIGDVVKARLSELSMEKEALQGMIMGM
jgi:CBS domain-containing protein